MPSKPTGRPRGRPKGSKNVPNVLQFTDECLKSDLPLPPLPKRKGGGAGVWAKMTPEQRSAYSAKIRAARSPENLTGGGNAGIPRSFTKKQFQAALEAQKPIIARIMKKMADTGQLPDDPMAVEALEGAMQVLRAPTSQKDKLAAARLVLDFTKSKPTAKVEHTVKTAEDFLDDLADEG